MGKLIQFPMARIRHRRAVATAVFGAFGELQTLERGQMKLIAGSACFALLMVFALQLALG